MPALAWILHQFPLEIVGFHFDNGSAYINGKAAKLLQKLPVEQTTSRSRHSSHNVLATGKNACVVRDDPALI